MSPETRTLIEQARAPPPEDRIALVEDMLDSLDRADPGIDQRGPGRPPIVLPPIGAARLAPKSWAPLWQNTGRDSPVRRTSSLAIARPGSSDSQGILFSASRIACSLY